MLSNKDVEKVAKLSKFNLNDSELEKYKALLEQALEYIKVLDELDTKGTVPTPQVTGLVNSFDQDVSHISLTQEEALQNAPSKERGFITTDAVIRKNRVKNHGKS